MTIPFRVAGGFDAATEMVDRAIVSNPNSWIMWEQRDDVFGSTGNFQEAIWNFERAMRLSPLDAIVFATYTGGRPAFIGLGRFDEAIAARAPLTRIAVSSRR
jgi:adenylate cyclase